MKQFNRMEGKKHPAKSSALLQYGTGFSLYVLGSDLLTYYYFSFHHISHSELLCSFKLPVVLYHCNECVCNTSQLTLLQTVNSLSHSPWNALSVATISILQKEMELWEVKWLVYSHKANRKLIWNSDLFLSVWDYLPIIDLHFLHLFLSSSPWVLHQSYLCSNNSLIRSLLPCVCFAFQVFRHQIIILINRLGVRVRFSRLES